ncbi:putative tellurium resistance membrane protein TerC [Wenyingzhuangia heitensis]|uniref:Tellurium resistance membrane protein TerC n=1 Tax=Wenyingzhuangia heitensis TaxID=1487859 RepID=A0ABX0UGB5_9FLAO|nr:TerC family protein [Wenyingzhuangia heitensis]NIJ46052.1 putative tellurium resistance membrane protein TerC [Wenyingzhuangia heitensis]
MLQEIIIPLVSLVFLEVVLGIDNIIFISILTDKLPEEKRDKLRIIGLALAAIIRIGLLTVVSWILKLDNNLFSVFGLGFSGKNIILLIGGIFLLYKASSEIFHHTETEVNASNKKVKNSTFTNLLIEILILDIVFSIDSIITAVGMVSNLYVMYAAVIISVLIMIFASKPIVNFINKHISFKILALCFLMMIGVSLIGEGLHFEIPKGYIYFSMLFAFLVDLIQIKTVKK